MTGTANTGSIDAEEIARFGDLSRDWWDSEGRMSALHGINPVRLHYIRDRLCARAGRDPEKPAPLDGLAVLDVGCGAGLLAEPLARLGAEVTGIDPAPEMIEVARAHAAGTSTVVDYRSATAEDLTASGAAFDVVLAMEVVEHAADAGNLLAACCALVRPGGALFAATINRTARSFGLAIVAAEYILRWAPRGSHDWRKFVRPAELSRHLRHGGLVVADITGVSYSPLEREWRASRDAGVNYMMTAEKPARAVPHSSGPL